MINNLFQLFLHFLYQGTIKKFGPMGIMTVLGNKTRLHCKSFLTVLLILLVLRYLIYFTVSNFHISPPCSNSSSTEIQTTIKTIKEDLDTTTNTLNSRSTNSFNEEIIQIETDRANDQDTTDPSLTLNLYVQAFNQMGKSYTTMETFTKELSPLPESPYKDELLTKVQEMEAKIIAMANENESIANKLQPEKVKERREQRTELNLATIACGANSKDQALVMIKSAVIFSQDADLHLIVFSDNSTIIDLAQRLLELKWTVNQLGWDFTFELIEEWFPSESQTRSTNIRNLWQPCATQRLFFPSLLPHIDSVLFLDADTIVLSNLTEMWISIEENMAQDGILAAIAPNTEYPALGHYNRNRTNKISPYYGHGGLNAGVMVMNLTRMREFDMEERSLAAFNLFKEKIILADQDIYNIIFHFYPEKLYVLDCTYNLYWLHCGQGTEQHCIHNPMPGPICFCNATLTSGVHIVHGNMGTFFVSHEWWDFPFLHQLYSKFEAFNLLNSTAIDVITQISEDFDKLDTPCFSLTSHDMYRNAQDYLNNIL